MSKSKIIPFLMAILSSASLSAQYGVDAYIQKGIQNSHVLQQKHFVLEAAIHALDASKQQRYLSVDFIPTYTLAEGGRRIAFPAGDLLNPVYSTLNELTASTNFPQIENVDEQLNPNNFYDLKLRASYPIVNPDIKINERIQALKKEIGENDINIYKRELSKDIELAYYDYQRARKGILIYQEAKVLIEESLRVNRGLFQNDKVNRTVIIQNEQDLNDINTEIKNAELRKLNAQAYLNFLINIPLETPVYPEDFDDLPPLDLLVSADHLGRKEINQLEIKTQINEQLLEQSESISKPRINAFVDIGAQDFDFNFDRNTPYALGGISMSLNVFSNGKNKLNTLEAQAQLDASKKETEQIKELLQLSVFSLKNDIRQAVNDYNNSIAKITTDQRVYQEKFKLYKNGKSTYITVSDARNDWLTSKLESQILLFGVWKKYAELKRASSL